MATAAATPVFNLFAALCLLLWLAGPPSGAVSPKNNLFSLLSQFWFFLWYLVALPFRKWAMQLVEQTLKQTQPVEMIVSAPKIYQLKDRIKFRILDIIAAATLSAVLFFDVIIPFVASLLLCLYFAGRTIHLWDNRHAHAFVSAWRRHEVYVATEPRTKREVFLAQANSQCKLESPYPLRLVSIHLLNGVFIVLKSQQIPPSRDVAI